MTTCPILYYGVFGGDGVSHKNIYTFYSTGVGLIGVEKSEKSRADKEDGPGDSIGKGWCPPALEYLWITRNSNGVGGLYSWRFDQRGRG
jgi:hypothetical protein